MERMERENSVMLLSIRDHFETMKSIKHDTQAP